MILRPQVRARRTGRHTHPDDGSVLPMVIVATMVLAMVISAVATYLATDFRYARVVEERADRLAAADGGMRFGIEKLRNFQTLCTTKAGTGGGYTRVFPPVINGATTEVTCQRVGANISDVQGWGVVVTGAGVPPGQNYFSTSGAGASDNVKTFSGPVYIADPTQLDMQANMQIKDGDLWYTRPDCGVPTDIPEISNGTLQFNPDFFRGPICTDKTWDGGLFTAPTVPEPPVSPVNPAFQNNATCRVFSPGKYTSLTLGDNNYFKAGFYYFENVDIILQGNSLIAGFPDSGGDSAKLTNTACAAEQAFDRAEAAANGTGGGATFFLGGSSRIEVRNNAGLEIFRKRVNETFLSVYALSTSGTGYTASTMGWNQWLMETKSGSNNDVAIHGLFWAPYSAVSLGNITNAANGQLLGGIVIARLDTQASASASAFLIGIETSPVDVKLLLVSTSTLNGRSTTIRAVVQFRPDSGELAVNSWRVVE